MEKLLKIAIVGCKGKMGSLLCHELKDDYDVVGIEKGEKLEGTNAELVVDFASAESSVESALWCKKNAVPIIIGSTGQSAMQMKQLCEVSKSVPVFKAGNFSAGIQFLKNSIFNFVNSEVQDVVVFEKHHKEKKDAPSGTAIEISDYILNNFKIKPSVIYERGGKEIGTHSVDIYYKNEVITITHKAFSREAFVDGVKKAIIFMQKTKINGLYSMENI